MGSSEHCWQFHFWLHESVTRMITVLTYCKVAMITRITLIASDLNCFMIRMKAVKKNTTWIWTTWRTTCFILIFMLKWGPFVLNERWEDWKMLIQNFIPFQSFLEFWWSLQSKVVKKMRAVFERITKMGTFVLSMISLDLSPLCHGNNPIGWPNFSLFVF